MGSDRDIGQPAVTAGLRIRAEEALKAHTPEIPLAGAVEDPLRLLHELQVHQIELEMQNAELRQARDELDKALDKYTDLYDFAPVGYFTLDHTGTVRGANLTGASLLGVERSRLIGSPFSLYVSNEARLFFLEFLGKVFTSPVKEVCDVPLKREGGHQLFVQIEAVASASFADCNIAVMDLSARKEAERLLKSERMLAQAQSIAHIGSWEWDSINDLITGSDEINRIFGLSQSSYTGFLELVHPDDRAEVYNAVQETISHQTPYDVHFRFIRSDGVTRVIHAQGEAITDGSGQTARMIGTAHDVTESREMADRMEMLNAELTARAAEMEAFNYMVAHDMRNPLNVICLYSQVIHERFGDKFDEELKGYVQEIYGTAQSMDRLINTLLEFSRTLKVEIHIKAVDLSKMAQEKAASLRMSEPGRRVTFIIADGVNVDGDANLLRIVLDNLIGNAWKYSGNESDTVIEFGVAVNEGKPAYFVRDNGSGFDMANADRLFLPFQRLHGSKVEGHGLGLAIVERIIRRHGGRVWGEGELGKGAVFYFTL